MNPNNYPYTGIMPYCPMMYPMAYMPYMQGISMEDGFGEESGYANDYRSYEVETISEESIQSSNTREFEEGGNNNSSEELDSKGLRQQEPEAQFTPGFPGYFPPGTPGIPGIPGAPGVPGGYVTPAEVLRVVELAHPDILRTMLAYGLPLPIARRLIRRIARITLQLCR